MYNAHHRNQRRVVASLHLQIAAIDVSTLELIQAIAVHVDKYVVPIRNVSTILILKLQVADACLAMQIVTAAVTLRL